MQSIANLVENYTEGLTYKIFCSNRDVDGTILPVETDQWVKHNINTQVWYSSKKTQYISILQSELSTYPDNILYINGIYSWNFNLLPLLLCRSPLKIISVRGMLHPGALSQKKVKKNLYLFVLKLLRVHRKHQFHASNNDEKGYIEDVFGRQTKINVAANFPRRFLRDPGTGKTAGSLKLVSIALISPMKNHLQVLDALHDCSKDIEYHIYGAVKDPAYWKQCENSIETLPPNIKVIFHGDIAPAKVEQALSDAHVFILPSKSENFGHAIFEALSAGKPVITSHNTPWNELKRSKAGVNVDPQDKDNLCLTIKFFAAMDKDTYNRWSNAAHDYSVTAIDINTIKDQYRRMFFPESLSGLITKSTYRAQA